MDKLERSTQSISWYQNCFWFLLKQHSSFSKYLSLVDKKGRVPLLTGIDIDKLPTSSVLTRFKEHTSIVQPKDPHATKGQLNKWMVTFSSSNTTDVFLDGPKWQNCLLCCSHLCWNYRRGLSSRVEDSQPVNCVLYSEHGFSMPWTVLGDPQGNMKLNMRMLISCSGDFPLIQGT